MKSFASSARRWLGSTSNRSFVAWPLALLLLQALIDQGMPQLNLWGTPLLVWGYAQYRLVGVYRSRLGGGGPGMSIPPERLVRSGPYTVVRNPMYLGHIIFFLGLAVTFSGLAWLLLLAHGVWFDRRARADERHLIARFDGPYREYLLSVKRWLPGIY